MIRKVVNGIRYNPYISKVLAYSAWPFFVMAGWFSRQIRMKIKVNGVTVTYDSIRVTFPNNVGVGFSSGIFWKGVEGFEPHTWKVIKALASRSDVFMDVGSNFGFYSALVHKINPAIQSLCFEPVPAIYEDNLRFHKANRVATYEVFNVAVSDASGKDTIFLPKDTLIHEVRSASLEKDFFYNQQFGQRQLTITKVTLDEFLAERHESLRGKKIVMKVDVEGHELAALRGAYNFVKSYRPMLVCEVDLNPANVDAIASILKDWDYVVYAVSPVGLFWLNTTEITSYRGGRDFLFLPRTTGGKTYLSFQELSSLVSP